MGGRTGSLVESDLPCTEGPAQQVLPPRCPARLFSCPLQKHISETPWKSSEWILSLSYSGLFSCPPPPVPTLLQDPENISFVVDGWSQSLSELDGCDSLLSTSLPSIWTHSHIACHVALSWRHNTSFCKQMKAFLKASNDNHKEVLSPNGSHSC